jgi:glycosyltransferase involved in cell wall biosynthesis
VAEDLAPSPLDVQIVSLSRNFGKEAALLAGLDHARLDAVLFIDGDGQHPPDMIETLVARWLDDGYDVVYTAKAHRVNESFLRRFGVHWFYALINFGQRQKIPEDAGDFRLLSPRAAAALRQMPERNRFFKGLSSWIGFRQVRVDYQPAKRAFGATTWNFRSLIGLSIEGLTSFTIAPLRVATLLGFLFSVTALFYGGWILLATLLFGQDVPGYPSIMVGIMVIGGVQLLVIGVLGEYIGKLLAEIKARPSYFVAEHSIRPAQDSAESKAAAARAAE